MPEIDWHFPRTDLARAYLSQFNTGLSHSLTLFAPRRKGKTEFLIGDLAPAAEESGYKVCYVSLWALKSDPAAALRTGLVDAASNPSIWQRTKRFFSTPLQSLDAEAAVAGATLRVGAEFESGHAASKDDLIEIPRALDQLARQAANGKAFLMLDEVQFLAKPVHETLVAALRTALDTPQGYRSHGLHRLLPSPAAGDVRHHQGAALPVFTAHALPRPGRGFHPVHVDEFP